jgi:hypothetical protein
MVLVAGNLGPGGTEKGFRIYWRWRLRRLGRPKMSIEVNVFKLVG